ncbi:MAG: EamA family transporter [Kiritimatiellia bacterium]|nr:EamA family transporter [Kiritimatiellia bacterium]
MIYLILSILFLSLLPVTMRIGLEQGGKPEGMNVFYRIIPGIMALTMIFFRDHPIEFVCLAVKSEAFFYGLVGTFFFWLGGYAGIKTVSYGPLGISWTIMRLSMLLPTLASVLYWHEIPLIGINGLAGIRGLGVIFASLAAILFGIDHVNSHKNRDVSKIPHNNFRVWIYWLAASFLLRGCWEIVLRASGSFDGDDAKSIFMGTVFIGAMLLSLPGLVILKKRINRKDIVFGLLLGICSLAGQGIRPWVLKYVGGIIVFPATSIFVSLLVLVFGYLFWREKIGRIGFVGIGATIVGILLLSVKLS